MKSPASYNSTLLFDFGCILVGLSKQRCIDALEKIGCGKIAYYVDECRQEDLFHDLEIGGSIEAFCEEARRQSSYTDEMGVFHPCTASDEEICWAWNELLTGVPVEKLRMVKHLKDSGYRTAILSNTNMIHWEKSVRDFFTIDGLTVDDYFDDIFLSCDLAMVKPDREIYEAVLQKLHSPLSTLSSSVTFIDDSLKNTTAAEASGINTIHDPQGDRWTKELVQKACVIGNFDGVHRGHQYLFSTLKAEARKRGLSTLAITFDKHPKELFRKDFLPTYLTTPEEKRQLILDCGIDNVLIQPFTADFADITAKEYMRILRKEHNVRLLLLGYDNRFGKRNTNEGFEQYAQYGKELGIEVVKAEAFHMENGKREMESVPSSSRIRHLLANGEVDKAAELLGRPYAITGKVVAGYQEGRKIGFPTANIEVGSKKLLPGNGVYETRAVQMENGKGETENNVSITNIGTRPTYNGKNVTVETHIPHFIGDLYGQTLTVELVRKIRDERSFSSTNELREQITKDLSSVHNS